MRKDLLGLLLMWVGAGTLFGAVQNGVSSRAIGGPLDGGFVIELVVAGLAGTVSFAVGVILVVQALRAPQPAPGLRGPPPPLPSGGTSWSAIAFLVLLVFLAALYLGLVFMVSGITGVVLQFVFFVTVGVVVLLLGIWWSRRLGWSNTSLGSTK